MADETSTSHADTQAAVEARITQLEIERETEKLEALGWPPSLVKAGIDQFTYALRLRSGEHVRFSHAAPGGPGWVQLHEASIGDSLVGARSGHYFPRGLDVQLSEIVWVADAPDGS